MRASYSATPIIASSSRCVRADARPERGQNQTRRFKAPTDDVPSTSGTTTTRRSAVIGAFCCSLRADSRAFASESIDELQRALVEAYDVQDFSRALDALDALRRAEPNELRWIEAKATVSVDAKQFDDALKAYDEAVAMCEGDASASARVLAGRALALEGVYRFRDALRDYDEVLRLCEVSGFAPDPYVLNSRGNVHGSLGNWDKAKDDYESAANLFQGARGFKVGASTTQRLDGAIYAFSNLALAEAQLGNEDKALKQLESLVRRAPNSADVRAACAALYYSAARFEDAEDAWERACSRESGCAKYRDIDYVTRIRRWPPVMVAKLEKFLAVR